MRVLPRNFSAKEFCIAMRRSFHNVSAVICLLLVLTVMTSCIIDVNPSRTNYVPEKLLGTWTSGYIYDESDAIHDYSHTQTLKITSDGYMTSTYSYYIKERTGATWAKNYAKSPVTVKYEILGHEYSSTDGYVSIYDPELYQTVARFDYRISESGDILVFTDKDDVSYKYARITETV